MTNAVTFREHIAEKGMSVSKRSEKLALVALFRFRFFTIFALKMLISEEL